MVDRPISNSQIRNVCALTVRSAASKVVLTCSPADDLLDCTQLRARFTD
jgi:hypothetical protein